LTVSPHKDSRVILEIGENLGGAAWLPMNFKKQDGFQKTLAVARERGFYRQNYCGCRFSLRDTL
jgi:predicted adenine nucleotide alpha hydrolase (AANH) superfamily ATPase